MVAYGIGELARRAETKAETVRWYEREGLCLRRLALREGTAPIRGRTWNGSRLFDMRANWDFRLMPCASSSA